MIPWARSALAVFIFVFDSGIGVKFENTNTPDRERNGVNSVKTRGRREAWTESAHDFGATKYNRAEATLGAKDGRSLAFPGLASMPQAQIELSEDGTHWVKKWTWAASAKRDCECVNARTTWSVCQVDASSPVKMSTYALSSGERGAEARSFAAGCETSAIEVYGHHQGRAFSMQGSGEKLLLGSIVWFDSRDISKLPTFSVQNLEETMAAKFEENYFAAKKACRCLEAARKDDISTAMPACHVARTTEGGFSLSVLEWGGRGSQPPPDSLGALLCGGAGTLGRNVAEALKFMNRHKAAFNAKPRLMWDTGMLHMGFDGVYDWHCGDADTGRAQEVMAVRAYDWMIGLLANECGRPQPETSASGGGLNPQATAARRRFCGDSKAWLGERTWKSMCAWEEADTEAAEAKL